MSISNYFNQFRNGDTTIPTAQVLGSLSKTLDAAMEPVIIGFIDVLRTSPEHTARVEQLKKQPRTSGPFAQSKILLKDASAFEQMVAVGDWLAQAQIKKVHTLFVSVGDSDYIPVKANKFSKDATLMHVVLGSTSGSHKAPKYADWANEDPWADPSQTRFIYPLEMLEIVRQPHFSGATILKGNAFESEWINSDWRYGPQYACVEGRGQSKDTKKKINSAGLNACGLVEALSDSYDPTAKEVDVCVTVKYENYTEEGYRDYLDISVSPGEVMEATQLAIERKRGQELTRLVENLAIAKLGPPKTPILREYIAGKLRANSKDN